ncbi:MAG: sialate O-acetylesterase [Chthoniobacterales bacterium]
MKIQIPLFLIFSACAAFGDVKLPAIISDHMVLLKSDKAPVWGTAAPGEEVTVTLDKVSGKAVAGQDGKWKIVLNLADSAPGPFTMTVQGKNALTVSDVLVGEVWLSSGQSNMAAMLQHSLGGKEEIAASANSMIRHFYVAPLRTSDGETLADDVAGKWDICAPERALYFSAVSYYFGKTLQRELKTPVGIIMDAYSGSICESWLSPETIQKVPAVKAAREAAAQYQKDYPPLFETYKKDYAAWLKQSGREDHLTPDVKAFAEGPVPAQGWVSVPIGSMSVPTLPVNGVVWLQKEVDIPATLANKAMTLGINPIEGFESVYWNGKLVRQNTIEKYPGSNDPVYTAIPADLMKEGKNTLAFRIYAPGKPMIFPSGTALAGQIPVRGDWSARAEYVLPMLSAEQLAALPKLPPMAVAKGGLSGSLYNAMLHPVSPYAIRGFLWYQGESNAGNAFQCREILPAMIEGWRKQWDRGDLPFYFCQLPRYYPKTADAGATNYWTVERESQSQMLRLPNTAQATLIDLGESNDIHPWDKKEVGERLALIALARDYGKKIPYISPTYESSKFEKGVAVVKFAHTDGGLVAKPVPTVVPINHLTTAPVVRNSSPDSQLEGFALSGADKKWFWADAKIQNGNEVVVWSDKVPAPVAIRYAWTTDPTVNLYNGAGLPAAPFRTDDYPVATQPAL